MGELKPACHCDCGSKCKCRSSSKCKSKPSWLQVQLAAKTQTLGHARARVLAVACPTQLPPCCHSHNLHFIALHLVATPCEGPIQSDSIKWPPWSQIDPSTSGPAGQASEARRGEARRANEHHRPIWLLVGANQTGERQHRRTGLWASQVGAGHL